MSSRYPGTPHALGSGTSITHVTSFARLHNPLHRERVSAGSLRWLHRRLDTWASSCDSAGAMGTSESTGGVRAGEQTSNGVLGRLPPDQLHRMSSYLERVNLPKGKVLYDYGDIPRYGYFLASGMAFVLAATEDGDLIQIATVARDGFAGLPIVLNTPAASQVVMHLS